MNKMKKKEDPEKCCVDFILVGSYDAVLLMILLVDKLLMKESI